MARRLIVGVYAALRAGDPGPALRQFNRRGRLRFAGSHSWAIDTTDPGEIAEWFHRFAQLRPELRANDVVVGGPPWRMSVCVVFDDTVRDPRTGEVEYVNHGVQYLRLRWGRVMLDEVVVDTQLVAEYDRLVAARGVPASAGGGAG